MAEKDTTPKMTMTLEAMLRKACAELRPFGVGTPEEALEIARKHLKEILSDE